MQIINAQQPFIEFHALAGSFYRVKYFLTKTDLRDVAENLQLAPAENLTFGERIQRVINEDRVKSEIVPYLEANDLCFFNALVCVLLPDLDNKQGYWSFSMYNDSQNQPIGGIGKLQIAKRVGRIVLDGQHRFQALRDLWEKHRDDRSSIVGIEIPLIFIVIDELGKIGGDASDARSKTITGARNLFATLNKTARRVDKATLLLIDDTDILNVATRMLVENGYVDENYTKWIGGQNLQPSDHYFTALHVIRDIINLLLQEVGDLEDISETSTNNVQQRADNLLRNIPKFECGLKEIIPVLFNKCDAYLFWKNNLASLGVKVERQPNVTLLNKTQRDNIQELRGENLIYTVAGQRCFFRSIISTFLYGRRDILSLESIIFKANLLPQNNFFHKLTCEDNPYFGILFDKRGRMSWGEDAVELSRKIFSVAIGANLDRHSILNEFNGRTDRDKSVLENYWNQTTELINKNCC